MSSLILCKQSGSFRTVGSILDSLPSNPPSRPNTAGSARSRPTTAGTANYSVVETFMTQGGVSGSRHRVSGGGGWAAPRPCSADNTGRLSSSSSTKRRIPRPSKASQRLNSALHDAEKINTLESINAMERHTYKSQRRCFSAAPRPPLAASNSPQEGSLVSQDALDSATLSAVRYMKETPVNARLFTHMLMQSNNSLFCDIKRVGEETFMSTMQSCCRRLGMRQVTVGDFFFLLSSALPGCSNGTFSKEEATYIFVFLDVGGQGVLEFNDFICSLRVLFKPSEVVAALCCKRILCSKGLDRSLLTIAESNLMLDSTLSLFPIPALEKCCGAAKLELLEMSVNYALPVPTVCATLQHYPFLIHCLDHLNWDGTLVSMEKPISRFALLLKQEEEEMSGDVNRSTSSNRRRITPRRMEHNHALLEHVHAAYCKAQPEGALFRSSSARRKTSMAQPRGSTADTAALSNTGAHIIDPTHPRFVADQYIVRSMYHAT